MHDFSLSKVICLELLERFDNIAVALFAAEEVGCVGSRNADPEFFERVGYVVEFDCPGRGLVSYTSGGVRLFQNDGDFIKTALPVMCKTAFYTGIFRAKCPVFSKKSPNQPLRRRFYRLGQSLNGVGFGFHGGCQARAARTSAACSSGFTSGQIFLIRPSGPIRKVTRCVPMYRRPMNTFSPHTP